MAAAWVLQVLHAKGPTGKKKSHNILAEMERPDDTFDIWASIDISSPNLIVWGQMQQPQPEKGMVTSLRSLIHKSPGQLLRWTNMLAKGKKNLELWV